MFQYPLRPTVGSRSLSPRRFRSFWHKPSLAASLIVAIAIGTRVLPQRLLAQTLPLDKSLIALNSDRGALLLRQSRAQADYVPLSTHFVTQINQAFCGVASISMVLNSLEVDAPDAEAWDQDYFTQTNTLNEQTEAIIQTSLIQRQGLTLAELAAIFETYPVEAEIHYGSELELEAFREMAIANLKDPNNFIVINYLRRAIGQQRGGHISPIAAYNAATDRFLVMDVSRYKYPPVWVKAHDLWKSLDTLDTTSGKSRGMLLIQRQEA